MEDGVRQGFITYTEHMRVMDGKPGYVCSIGKLLVPKQKIEVEIGVIIAFLKNEQSTL
jgi:hypothetical protein